MRRWPALMTGLVLLLGSAAVGVRGQEAWAGATLQTYMFPESDAWDVDRVQLLSAPFGAAWTAGGVGLEVRGAHARGIATFRNGGSSEIAGLTDSRLMLTLARGPVTFTGLGVLPTGDATHSVDEISLLGMASSELLPFALTSWGTGGGIGGRMGIRGVFVSTEIDLSGAFYWPLAYRPLLDTTPFYQPGSQVLGTAALGWSVGGAGILRLIVAHQLFLDDAYDDLNLLRASPRTEGTLSFTRAVGARESASVYTRYRALWGGTLRGVTPHVTGQHFPGVAEPAGRHMVAAGMELHVERNRFTILPSAEFRLLTTEHGSGSGWTGAAGLDVDYRPALGGLTRRWTVSPRARVVLGGFEGASGTETGFMGWELGASVRWEGR